MTIPYKVWRQYCLPQHGLTWLGGLLSHSQIPWLKNKLIQHLLDHYPVNLAEALDPNPKHYASFHDFFTRHLKPECRPQDPSPLGINSPCDGTVSEFGKINEDTLIQAKNHTYRVSDLLASEKEARLFHQGHFMTIYLAPQDYHRVHMPYAGTIETLRYVPGKLFSVNPSTVKYVPNLFARNERVITLFKSDHGSFAIILVGAMIVGSMNTRWGKENEPHHGKTILTEHFANGSHDAMPLDKGEEMGYFSLGSTVILLFANDMTWEYDFNQQSPVVLGQKIGHF